MSNSNECTITPTQALVPVIMVSCVVFLFLAFQSVILIQDHSNLAKAYTQQQPVVEQVKKVKDQLDALAIGTLKLSQVGDKEAMNIMAMLKKAGVNIADPSAQPGSGGVTPPMMPTGMMQQGGAPMPTPTTPLASAPPPVAPHPQMPSVQPMSTAHPAAH